MRVSVCVCVCVHVRVCVCTRNSQRVQYVLVSVPDPRTREEGLVHLHK